MRIRLLVFFTVNVFVGNAQVKIYDSVLKSYLYRTDGYKALVIGGGAGNSFSLRNSMSNSNSFSISPVVEYFSVKSTDKKQLFKSGYVNPGISYQKQKNENSIATDRISASNFNAAATSNLKSFSGRHFIEAAYAITGRGAWSREKYADTMLQKSARENLLLGLIFGVGIGRIENVTDAQMAFYILSDLQNQKLLSKEFTATDMDGLAKTITNINNTRLFDYRRKNRFELQQIDSFLQRSKLVDTYSINYFTTLTDNWLYSFNPYRQQGKQKYIRIKPGINYWQDKNEVTKNGVSTFENGTFYNAVLSLVAGIDNKKAVSIKQQFNRGFSLGTSYGYLHSKGTSNTVNNLFSSKGWSSEISGYLEWGYFPNSRTIFFGNINSQFSYEYLGAFGYNKTSLFFTGSYFIGYNTRLFVDEELSLNTPIVNAGFYGTFLNNFFGIGIQHFLK